jgi:catechol 2,3-dioxygenase-like lactoylglutathione lyase family enzyme
MLIVADAEAAVRWYAQALGAAVVWDPAASPVLTPGVSRRSEPARR